MRRFRVGYKAQKETTPRCWCTALAGRVEKKHTEGDSLNIQVTRRGRGKRRREGGFTCGDDFIYGHIYIHISLSLTGGKQGARVAGDILFIIISFHICSSIKAGQSQMI